MQFDMIFGALFMFAWVFFSMSVMMNLFMIIVGDSFEVVQETHKFNWLTDERALLMDKTQREFDETSSSSSSDSSEGRHVHEVPLKKKLRSVRALKAIMDEDYEEYVKRYGAINESMPNEPSPASMVGE
jgi:hypothetical protein